MFDVGFWEILLILVLALVVIGPERLPGAARKAGYLFGKARRYIEGVRSEVESEIDVGEFKRMLHNQEVQINELQQQLKSASDDVSRDIGKLGDRDNSPLDVLTDVPSHSFHDADPKQSPADEKSPSDEEATSKKDASASPGKE